MNSWKRWKRHPQRLWFRKALFQIHLWTGIGVGVYILLVSISGSLLVYRNELYRAATPDPIIVAASGTRLSPDELKEAAIRAYPGYAITRVFLVSNPDQAVAIGLTRGSDTKERLFDPYTGRDLGNSIARAILFLSWLLDLHDNLLFGRTGRLVNGIGALCLLTLALTGAVIWWPGARMWRRSLTPHRNVSWKRFTWDLHSAMGFWSVPFLLLFGITGVYLSYPDPFQAFADSIEPPTADNAGFRAVDTVTYWLAYLHFGRFGGWSTKLIWAVLGMAPACLFVSGALMWWIRVVRRARRGALQDRAVSVSK
jgi:uncharacterized iron-regulated membrane protein